MKKKKTTDKVENKYRIIKYFKEKWRIHTALMALVVICAVILTGCSLGQKVTILPKKDQAISSAQQTVSEAAESEQSSAETPKSAEAKIPSNSNAPKTTPTPVPSLAPAVKEPYQASEVKKPEAVSPLQADKVEPEAVQTAEPTEAAASEQAQEAVPELTKTPIVTATPVPEPVVTDAPEPEPMITDAPEPEITDTPEAMQEPEATDTPEMVQESEVTDTPEVVQEPEENIQNNEAIEARGVIVLDPGHSGIRKGESVPIGPGSSEMKDGDAVGTSGVASGLHEYELNLAIAQQLKAELEARGYAVILTHEDNETAINCDERAEVANAADADCFIRIHADGAADGSAAGASAICITEQNPWTADTYHASRQLSDCILSKYCEETGIANRGIIEEDNMTGNNWSRVPTTLLEMGFMTNPDEDLKMADPGFQQIMVLAIADGIEEYFRREAAGENMEGAATEEDIAEEERPVEESAGGDTAAEESAVGNSVAEEPTADPQEPTADPQEPAADGEVPAEEYAVADMGAGEMPADVAAQDVAAEGSSITDETIAQ